MTDTTYKLRPNGELPIRMGWPGAFQKIKITGGPFDAFNGFKQENPQAFGVCVRSERVPGNVDVSLPIHDFEAPPTSALTDVTFALKSALRAALEGKDVYVGCMGGWGRTGLFMALLAKVAGVKDPVEFVRDNYTPHAVETDVQFKYVKAFDVGDLHVWFIRACWRKRWFGMMYWWA